MSVSDKKINILYVAGQGKYVGGAETGLVNIINNLDLNTFNPLVVLPENGKVADLLRYNKIKAEIIPMTQWASSGKMVSDFIKNNHIDLIHAMTIHMFEFKIAVIAKRLGIPYIWHIHGDLRIIYAGLKHDNARHALELIYSLSRAIVVCSKYAKDQFSELGLTNNIVVIKNGVDLNAIERSSDIFREAAGVRKGDFLVAMVGRIAPQKRVHDFIKAASRVRNRMKGGVRFIIVGDDSKNVYADKLKRINGKSGRPVIFTGFYNKIGEVMNSIDLLVLPSMGDAAPMVVLEAMVYGKPIIAADSGGIKEMIKNGETGVLIPPKDHLKLAKAIIDVIREPAKAKSMGMRGRKRLLRYYDIRKNTGMLQHLYIKIIK